MLIQRGQRRTALTLQLQTNISINVGHGFIRRFSVTSLTLHVGQMPSHLLDPTNDSDFVLGDSVNLDFHID